MFELYQQEASTNIRRLTGLVRHHKWQCRQTETKLNVMLTCKGITELQDKLIYDQKCVDARNETCDRALEKIEAQQKSLEEQGAMINQQQARLKNRTVKPNALLKENDALKN